VHYLDDINEDFFPNKFQLIKANTEEFANHINSCYEKESDVIAATGIAEFDS
jgi:hypothetical protein